MNADQQAAAEVTDYAAIVTEIRDRCERAEASLTQLIGETDGQFRIGHLKSKREGVRLALSYIDETIRGLDQ